MVSLTDFFQFFIIAADDFLPGSLLYHSIIYNAASDHVDPHIGGRLVGGASIDFFKNLIQNRENSHITVVIDGGFAIGFQVIGINHIHIAQINGGSFVSQIHRMP